MPYMSLFTRTGHLLPFSQFRERLAQGADPNEVFHGSERYSRIPLIVGVSLRSTEYLRALLADPRTGLAITDLQGRTALHIAAERANLEAIGLLCEAGAPLDAGDIDGRTPLHHALRAPDPQSIGAMQRLMEYGANVSAQDKFGRTVLHEVMLSGSSFWHKPVDEKTAFLLRARCALDVPDERGRTPLHYAAVTVHHRVVRALLAAGANAELFDHDGYRPVDDVRRQIAEDSLGLDNHMGYFEDLQEVLNVLVFHTRSRLTRLVGSVVARTGGQSGALVRRM
ncbi:ankyrin repeat domain-containing protein [Stenotrophomonas maltophilia]|nr:ankyrin repeat domain-containing protein [Stenotrophomonas maltophilia]